jgi:hypothetical protein
VAEPRLGRSLVVASQTQPAHADRPSAWLYHSASSPPPRTRSDPTSSQYCEKDAGGVIAQSVTDAIAGVELTSRRE